MDDPIVDYLNGLDAPLRDIGLKLLETIEATLPVHSGAIWHGHPVWSLGDKPGKQPVCLVKGHKSHLTFGFWRGRELPDPSGRLEPGARQMASVKLVDLTDIDDALFTDWLTHAVALETSP